MSLSVPDESSFLAVCVQKLLTHGPHSLSLHQCRHLEKLQGDTRSPRSTRSPSAPSVVQQGKPCTTGKRKKTKAANALVQLPTGTSLFRTIGNCTFEAVWNNETRTITWNGNVYPSPTAFCKACYASIHGREKMHSVNGQAACYILREEKRVTLEMLRNEISDKS